MKRGLKKTAVAIVAGTAALFSLVGIAYAAFLVWGYGPQAARALARHDYAQALSKYDSALAAGYWPGFYRAALLIERGRAQMGLGRSDRAIADCTAALALRPASEAALALRGLAHAARGETARAADDLDRAIALQPDNPQLYLWRAILRDSNLDLDRAIADYATVIRLAPQVRIAYTREAYALARQHKNELAADLISDLPIGEAYDAAAYNDRAAAFDTVGASDRAVADYAQSLRIEPHSSLTHSERGLAYLSLGDNDAAMNDFSEAIAIDPANSRAYFARGRLEYAQGDFEKARADLERTVELKPAYGYPPLWLDLALVRLGKADPKLLAGRVSAVSQKEWPWPIVEFYLGRRDEASMRAAAREAKDAATVADRTCEADYYAGALRLAEGRRDEAIPSLRKAAETCPPGFVELIAARSDLKRLGH